MTVYDLVDLLSEHRFFHGLDKDTIHLLRSCAQNAHLREDEYLFRTGEPADTFYVVRQGLVALELSAPARKTLVLETVGEDGVLGWSWLVPPYKWFCDARAVEPTDVVVLDGACLRAKCDADPALGYALLTRVSRVMHERLQATRVRLLDLYGGPGAHL